MRTSMVSLATMPAAMLLYYCAPRKTYKRLVQNGLPAQVGKPWKLWRNLTDAQSACDSKLLVIDGSQLSLPDSDEKTVYVDAVSKTAFLNVSPYVPPKEVIAGGGYVIRPGETEPSVLLIFRRGVWDLPKGKLDPGETIEACALREVQEEVGIRELTMTQPLGTTLHTYREKGYFRIKTTYWYQMATPETNFTPQAEEDIEAVTWMPWSKAVAQIGYDTLRQHMIQVAPLVGLPFSG